MRGRLTLLMLLAVGCSRHETARTDPSNDKVDAVVRLASENAKLELKNEDLSLDVVALGEKSRQLGYQQAQLDAELLSARAQLKELQQVTVMVDCLERKSGKSVKVALKNTRLAEGCRDEVLALTSEQLDETAEALIAKPRKPR